MEDTPAAKPTTLKDEREQRVARMVRDVFKRIKVYDPDLYGYALAIASKLDQDNWREQADAAVVRRIKQAW
jgi:hypothetical protein